MTHDQEEKCKGNKTDDSPSTFRCVNRNTQLGVICKLAESAEEHVKPQLLSYVTELQDIQRTAANCLVFAAGVQLQN